MNHKHAFVYFIIPMMLAIPVGLQAARPKNPPNDTSVQKRLTKLEEMVGNLVLNNARQQAVIDDLVKRNRELLNRVACVSGASGTNDFIFDGCNVHVRNGLNTTKSINGLGNIIVGYNAVSIFESDKRGSHNLVIGDEHNYNRFGGLVVGFRNTIAGNNASVIGGSGNTASGLNSSVTGGSGNTASGDNSSMNGGQANQAIGFSSSVTGGQFNQAIGSWSSVTGGFENIASEIISSVTGGRRNTASGRNSSVSGGLDNTASGLNSSVTGGSGNTAGGLDSSVSGGTRNEASGFNSSVSGGADRSVSGQNDWRAGSLFEDN